jgi:hypothetical protein
MKLLTKPLLDELLRNGCAQAASEGAIDFKPVVKLFTPDGAATWLLTEADPDCPDILFGLCDLGMGFPELGCVSLTELMSVRGALGLPIERDLHFEASKTLSEYYEEAYQAGRICV